jgi:hypothetical protein
MSHRSQTAPAAQDRIPTPFDRLTFTACMVTVAVTLAVLAGYGPDAALRHIIDVLQNPPLPPLSESDFYALSAMPF